MSSSAAGVNHSSILKATVPNTFAAKDLWSLLVGSSTMVKPGVWGRFSESNGRWGLPDLAFSFLSPFTVIVLLRLRAGVGGTPLVPLVFGVPGRPCAACGLGVPEGNSSSGVKRVLGFGTNKRELRAAGGPLGGLRLGQRPLSGLSWEAR